MLTLRAAATLLSQADSLASLAPLARLLAFTSPPLPLPAESRDVLGLDEVTEQATLTVGADSLRLLCASLPANGEGDLRERTRRACLLLARRAPASQWCVITLDDTRRTLCIATVTADPAGPRIAALRIDRDRVVDSDAETLRALAAVTEPHGALRHARFTDILRRDALSARFYRELESTVDTLATSATGLADPSEKRELSLLCTSRCLFLAFLEAKGWLDDDRNFLLRHATSRLEAGGHLHDALLRPLFFGTLNTPRRRRAPTARAFGAVPFLNGGLFSPTPLERRRERVRFADDALVGLIGDLLDRYRFTAHEDSSAWSEAAVDPEMLGRAFESLMARDERHGSGAFYTPPALVEQVVSDALSVALPELAEQWEDGVCSSRSSPGRADLLMRLQSLRVLDPACGSGAFLVHALERMAALRIACGDERPSDAVRRDTLTQSIFGVDRNPVAVWLCELRLWLSVVIECERTRADDVPPLPNLDHHIRVGNTLTGGDFCFSPTGGRHLSAMRARYARSSGGRKQSLGLALERAERCRAIAELDRRVEAVRHERRGVLQSLRARDLFGERITRSLATRQRLTALRASHRALQSARRRLESGGALPFRFASHFADVGLAGGFSLILGNPPWVRPHAVPVAERAALRQDFQTVRHASWRRGAERAGAGVGFSAQADLSVAFVERSVRLLSPSGTLALLLPAKLWRSLSGGGVRSLLCRETAVRIVRDYSDGPALFDAAVYPSLVVARGVFECRAVHSGPGMHEDGTTHPRREILVSDDPPTPTTPRSDACSAAVRVSVSRRTRTHVFDVNAAALSFGGDVGAPWILLPPSARGAFETLRDAGPALGDSGLGRPTLGVKCGCNAAFIVDTCETGASPSRLGDKRRDPSDGRHADEDSMSGDDVAVIEAGQRRGLIERQLLRPLLRGEDIENALGASATPTNASAASSSRTSHIIWTHGEDGRPLRVLPPRAARWMSTWRPQLEQRGDARRCRQWWTLFRTESARADCARLVWADIGKRLRTRVLAAGDPTVPLNSCYVLRAASDTDAFALEALLSSLVSAAWMDVLAEPARGGFRRFLGWTVAAMPIPRDWARARVSLADLGVRIARGESISDVARTEIVSAAYGLTTSAIEPLLAWHADA